MLRPTLCLFLMLATLAPLHADPTRPGGEWDAVAVAPVKTSIYIGSVTLITGEFRRDGDKFATTYEAKVWPWFFWSETGHIAITLPPANLDKLARGERIEFSGEAFNKRNKPRRITGLAERTDGATGRLKIRIGVDDTELIFNASYRFSNAVK